MSKKIKFRPDYARLYPGVDIPADVLDFLEKSDMRMEYKESHRKRGRVVKDADGNITAVLPSLEDSYERLLEADVQFLSDELTPEQHIEAQEEVDELYCCLDLLNGDERALIDALFFKGLTEQEYALKIGITQQAVNKRKQKILAMLKISINY